MISVPDPMAQVRALLPFTTSTFSPQSGYVVNFHYFIASPPSEIQSPL
jgi:hypothetical protein